MHFGSWFQRVQSMVASLLHALGQNIVVVGTCCRRASVPHCIGNKEIDWNGLETRHPQAPIPSYSYLNISRIFKILNHQLET
jgi:hypothetical protein